MAIRKIESIAVRDHMIELILSKKTIIKKSNFNFKILSNFKNLKGVYYVAASRKKFIFTKKTLLGVILYEKSIVSTPPKRENAILTMF